MVSDGEPGKSDGLEFVMSHANPRSLMRGVHSRVGMVYGIELVITALDTASKRLEQNSSYLR